MEIEGEREAWRMEIEIEGGVEVGDGDRGVEDGDRDREGGWR